MPSHTTLAAAITRATEVLTGAGVAAPDADARALVAAAAGADPATLADAAESATITPSESDKLAGYIARRAAREPLAYILGRSSFRGLNLMIDARVLDPDAEASGKLVEVAHKLAPGSRVHDIGTGSGCLALAIKHERPDLIVTGSDISPAAIDVASTNAQRLDLDVNFTVAAWLPPGDQAGRRRVISVNRMLCAPVRESPRRSATGRRGA